MLFNIRVADGTLSPVAIFGASTAAKVSMCKPYGPFHLFPSFFSRPHVGSDSAFLIVLLSSSCRLLLAALLIHMRSSAQGFSHSLLSGHCTNSDAICSIVRNHVHPLRSDPAQCGFEDVWCKRYEQLRMAWCFNCYREH